MNDEALLLLYEESHARFATPDTRIACLNFWLGSELQTRGISCVSLGDYPPAPGDATKMVTAVRAAAREWYRQPVMDFFSYKGIPLGEAFEPMLDGYLCCLAYWRYSFARILNASPDITKLIIPHSDQQVSATTSSLAIFNVRAAVAAARSLAEERGLAFVTLGDMPQAPVHHVYPRSRLKDAVIALYNLIISFAPRRPLKVFASEYWSNIAPFVTQMDDIELVLMDRSEFRAIPLLQLWRHRIRFIHPRVAARRVHQTAVRSALERLRTAWPAARETLGAWEGWKRADIPWAAVQPALDYLVEKYVERIIADSEGLEYILTHERPEKVLLRASVGSTQPHFFLAARIAQRLGIPSVELQHAGASVDPSSVHSRLEADYLASYGANEGKWQEKNGYALERIIPIGSPRFDRCIEQRGEAREDGKRILHNAGFDLGRPILLVAVPAESLGLCMDSYSLAKFFRTMRSVQMRTLDLQVVFKFRPGSIPPAMRAFVRELMPDAACMAREDLFSLICASDAVVCGNSSVIYEAVLGERPLVIYPWCEYFTYYVPMYETAAPIIHDDADLPETVGRVFADDRYRQELLARGVKFLVEYSFDGKSAERMMALLRENLIPLSR